MLSSDDILIFLRKNRFLFKEHFHCQEIGLFGSFARNEQNEESDIDLLVVFDPNVANLYEVEKELKDFLQKEFNRSVDICAKKWISPIFKSLILNEAIYA